jgi:hypothetical protein
MDKMMIRSIKGVVPIICFLHIFNSGGVGMPCRRAIQKGMMEIGIVNKMA